MCVYVILDVSSHTKKCIKRFTVVIENEDRNNMSFLVTCPLFCDVASSLRILVRYQHRQASSNQSAYVCQPVCPSLLEVHTWISNELACQHSFSARKKILFLLKFCFSSFHLETQVNTLKAQDLYKRKVKSKKRKTKESLKDNFEAGINFKSETASHFWVTGNCEEL